MKYNAKQSYERMNRDHEEFIAKEAYDEAIRVMKKPKHDKIDKAQRLRINQ